jgi:hypothetical protein
MGSGKNALRAHAATAFSKRRLCLLDVRVWHICDLWRRLNEGRLRQLSGRVATAPQGPGLTPTGHLGELLLNHPVGAGEQRGRHGEAESFSHADHSGSPALRRPSSSLSRSSGRRNRRIFLTCERRQVGSFSRTRLIACRASSRRPLRAAAAASIRIPARQFGCPWIAFCAQEKASS